MKINCFVFNHIFVNTYLLTSGNGEAAVIDPGCSREDEERRLLGAIAEGGHQVRHILLTHAHADHIQGCETLKKAFPDAVLSAHPDCERDYNMANAYGSIFGFPEHNYPPFDNLLEHGGEISFGSDSLRVLHTPGHAKGCVCLYSEKDGVLFSGDTLLRGSVGRTDLPGGSQQELLRSLKEKLAPLPDSTRVCCGHGEETTIAEERRYNPYFTF